VETIAAIDVWIETQPDPKPTRPEAIRRLVELGLAAKGSASEPNSSASSGFGQRLGLSTGPGVSHGGRRNGKFAVFAYSSSMNRPLPLIAGLLGVLFLAVAAAYWFVPASGLPSFFPGFKAGSDHIAVKHAIGSLIIALVLFAFAWLQSRRKARGVRI
jgi:hypothetical protein